MTESKTDALPKRGHVNEVCKEWLVREDGALAYKLQSQEINDFYKGNRYRNEVVRTDFPKALDEQIREKESAQKHKKYLLEQEKYDKHVAMKIADKLEQDQLEQRRLKLEEDEKIADQLQELYVNLPQSVVHLESPSTQHSKKASIVQSSQTTSQIHPQSSHSLHSDEFIQPMNPLQMSRSHNSQDIHHARKIPSNSSHINRTKVYTEQVQESYFVGKNIQNSDSTQPSHNHNHGNKKKHSKYTRPDQISDEFHFQNLPPHSFERFTDNPLHQTLDVDNDIELDPALQTTDLPIEEMKQISRKIKQEKKDEELARKLQEMEKQNEMTLEARDRLLAIEAQDKELAKMLQEREKSKAKKAKEKARLRKQQNDKSNSTRSGPLLPLPQDSHIPTSTSKTEDLIPIDMEAYSNPKDLISHQRMQSEDSRGSSIDSTLDYAEKNKEDDIYTLPINSCSSKASISHAHENLQNHSLSTSDHFPPVDMPRERHDIQINHSMSVSYDQSSSSVPPYMPFQGTRRSNSNEERTKKSKDKCTHQ